MPAHGRRYVALMRAIRTMLALASALVAATCDSRKSYPVFPNADPVTLDYVTFTTATSIPIGGPGAFFDATITNNSGLALRDVAVQNWIVQDAARRAAAGQVVSCTGTPGELPPGHCTHHNNYLIADNFVAGTGTLVPGSATAVIQLVRLDSAANVVLDSLRVSVTLTAPPRGRVPRP